MKLVLSCLLAAALQLSAAAGEPPVLTYGTPESAGMDAAPLAQAASLYRGAVERDELRRAVVMVARRGRIVLHEAFGWRHRGYGLPMERDTLFRMASNTKPVVAAGALILVEAGKIKLEDRVSAHFESFRNWRSSGVTLFQLLTHTSGLRIRPIFYPFDEKDGAPTLRAAVDRFGAEGPEVEPGTSYSYNNAGYNTAGALIEHAAGMPLEAFLRERIYEPLGMRDTSHREDPAKLHRMATVYRGKRDGERIVFEQGFTPDDRPDFPVVRASGGMISTPADYAKFLQMVCNGGVYGGVRILSAESIRKATSPLVKVGGAGDAGRSYGLGWMVEPGGSYGHGGSDGTMAWIDPARELFGLVFTQSPGGKNPTAEFKRLVAEACRPRS